MFSVCYRAKGHASLRMTPYKMLFGVRPRNADSIQFIAQLLEERLLAMQDRKDQVHSKVVDS